MGIVRIRGTLKSIASFQRWTPLMGVGKLVSHGKSVGSHMVGENIQITWILPLSLGGPDNSCARQSNAIMMGEYPSTIP